MTAYEYLLSYHIKPSVQRIAIMDYLLNHKTHPCIDEIHTALCKVCNKIYDVEIPQNLSEAEPFRKEGFIVEEVHQYYKGVCPECAEKGLMNN